MAFCITFGTHEFTGPLEGYEGITLQCRNCGNLSAHCIRRWPWFTVCFVPVLPLATHKYEEVACPICHFMEDLKNRQGELPQRGGLAGPPQQQGIMGGGPPGGRPGGGGGGGPPFQYK